MAGFAYAQVAAVSPLTLYFDGDATHPVPALKLSSYTPVVGDRVRVEVRSPLLPIVQAKVS